MSNYKIKLHGIKGFAFDVDGVMTDGSILSTPDGDLLRVFSSKDGFALRMARMNKFPTAIISGGESQSIVRRFLAVGVKEEDIYEKSRNKLPDFFHFCSKYGLKPEEVAYMGDDIPDIPILKNCGLAVCPADSVAEVKEVCDYVSMYDGGKGCVRELVEQVLKIQGKWILDLEKYSCNAH